MPACLAGAKPAACARGGVDDLWGWEREQAAGRAFLRYSTLQEEGGAAEIVRNHLDRVQKSYDVPAWVRSQQRSAFVSYAGIAPRPKSDEFAVISQSI